MKLDQIWGGFFAGFLRWVYPKKQQVFWVSTRVSEPCRMDERLSWHSWLTYSRHFTHISGHPSTADRAHDRESSPVKD